MTTTISKSRCSVATEFLATGGAVLALICVALFMVTRLYE